MTRSLWILMAIALAGMAALLWMSRTVVVTVSGVEEAVALQEAFRAGAGGICEREPALRVLLVPGAAGESGGRWKVEATLRRGAAPGNGVFELWRERTVARALTTRCRGRDPLGVILLFHRPGSADVELRYDGQGRPEGGKRPGATATPGGNPR